MGHITTQHTDVRTSICFNRGQEKIPERKKLLHREGTKRIIDRSRVYTDIFTQVNMEGCLGNVVKYLLFTTNFLVLVLSCAVFGVSIWFLADSPSFMDLFKKVEDILGTDASIGVSTAAAILLLVISIFVIVVAFFGCCGAYKENRCMLGTYFAIVLVAFVVMIVGAVLGYTTD